MRDRERSRRGIGRAGSVVAGALVVAVGLLVAMAVPSAASAAVRIGPDRIVVSTPGASATIEREPLRISFADADGRTVLRGLSGAKSGVQVVPPAARPQFGSQGTPPPTLYAPLSFLVGQIEIDQFDSFQWNGNLNSINEGGIEYGATAVRSASRSGGGVRIALDTSDPTGRKLIVRIAPGPARGTIELSARPDRTAGVAAMGDSFKAASDEAFRGFGGRHNSLDQSGDEFYNWTQQENLSSGSPGGVVPPDAGDASRYMFPNGQHAAYYVQSSFVSPQRYGFLLDRDELSHWRMASDRDDSWHVQSASRRLDYIVAPGSSRSSIRRLTSISGRHRVPPRWAVGPILDRLVEFPDQPAADFQADVRADLRDMKRFGVRLSAYRIEGWQYLPREFLRRTIRTLRRRGVRPMVYFRSFVGKDEIGTDDPSAFDEAIAKGYVATRANGEPYVFNSNFNADAAQIDYTDPAAVRWWKGRVKAALKLGAEGFMQDFGEQVQVGMHFDSGATGATMHNRISVLFHRATWQAVRAFERSHPRRRIFYFTRNGYSGTPGAARYEFANFPGDETTDWSRSSGIASLTTDMLNRGIGGAYGFTTDIGGFFDVPYGATTKELFIRWAQWSALSPMFRVHGSVDAGTHTPWSYDAQTLRIYKRLSKLHRRAEPLIMRLWRQAARTGVPIARPLWLEYPNDRVAAAQDQQWMLGRNLLVAPVVAQEAVSRDVYFPRGCWRTRNGKRYRGPATVEISAGLKRLPFFIRCGTSPLD